MRLESFEAFMNDFVLLNQLIPVGKSRHARRKVWKHTDLQICYSTETSIIKWELFSMSYYLFNLVVCLEIFTKFQTHVKVALDRHARGAL